jgi:hypothetical protein
VEREALRRRFEAEAAEAEQETERAGEVYTALALTIRPGREAAHHAV